MQETDTSPLHQTSAPILFVPPQLQFPVQQIPSVKRIQALENVLIRSATETVPVTCKSQG